MYSAQKDVVTKVMTKVFKNRIRIKEFFSDFDKLRCGHISQAQFKSGLSMAGIQLTVEDMEELTNAFANPEDPQLRINYRQFVLVVDDVFGKTDLEKMPTLSVHTFPEGLIPENRFTSMPNRQLSSDDEQRLALILEQLTNSCKTKRILVKPFFDDACRNQNSPMLVNHVSTQQFKQALKNHIAPEFGPQEVDILIKKYKGDDQFDNMVNYVAFANTIDPKEPTFDPYSLKVL